jgi:hypothetical protein
MFLRTIGRVIVLLTLLGPAGSLAADRNWWPIKVERERSPEERAFWTGLGPLAFYQPIPDGRTAQGFRPLIVTRTAASGDPEGGTVLYPLVRWEWYPDGHHWTLFNLINHRRVASASGAADLQAFDVWPVYFSRQTGEPETSYRAVFPIYGDVRQRFGQDRWTWVLFPLYGRFEQNGVTTTTVPWPFIKVLRGDGNRGLEVWPIAGRRQKPGVYRTEFALWPLLYRHVTGLDQPEPKVQAGFLPFYALDRQPGYVSETFGWPFWGYVHRTEPYQYHARHYFWPFWVQGRGDDRYVNRWAPFYTHSIIKETEKRWWLWPVWRHETWTDAERLHDRRQVVYFLYHSTRQHSRTNPAAAPATKTHLWPLFSAWHDGAGRRQVQALSPLEVFFPHNEHMRVSWSPLFAVYRFDQPAQGETRHSVLWDAVTYRRSDTAGVRNFQIGPLLGIESSPHFRRFSLLNGLVGLQRTATSRWRFFFRAASSVPAAEPAASP